MEDEPRRAVYYLHLHSEMVAVKSSLSVGEGEKSGWGLDDLSTVWVESSAYGYK